MDYRAVGSKFILGALKRAEPWELVTAFLGGYEGMIPREMFEI